MEVYRLVSEHSLGFIDVHTGQAGLAVARAVPSLVDVGARIFDTSPLEKII